MVGRNCWPHYNCVFRFAILQPRDIAQVQFGRMNPKMSYLIFTVCPDNDLKCPKPSLQTSHCTYKHVSVGVVLPRVCVAQLGFATVTSISWLAAKRPINMLVYLRDGPAQTIVCADKLRRNVLIQLAL